MIRYLSLCSGIEAFSCAVKDMPEFQPVAFAEIEPFPCKVLAHHYPNVPNLGDITKINGADYRGAVDLIVGGTPCQDFSVAGTRKGLAGERSGLARDFVRIIGECRPRWVLWENVPGCTSTPSHNPGGDFAAFITALHELGYCIAYRILDAQYFGTPQRRRRVFLIGYLGADWRSAAEVLFEFQSLCGNPTPRRKARKEIAKCITTGIRTRLDAESDTFAISSIGQYTQTKMAGTLRAAGGDNGGGSENLVCGTLCASGAGLSRPAGQGNELDFCIPIQMINAKSPNKVGPLGVGENGAPSYTCTTTNSPAVGTAYAVRRLTPLECERLQGFPDRYTDIHGASDTARYKALGNSMCVNVMRWIAERMVKVNKHIS